MTTKITLFEELTNTELYECLALRFEVFVVEQECIYPEFDEVDNHAHHMLFQDKNHVAGYLRMYVDKDNYARIGRIVIHKDYRGKDYGKLLINKAIDFISTSYSNKIIKINAQEHLKAFYESFGFIQKGVSYLDYGISHIDMEVTIL